MNGEAVPDLIADLCPEGIRQRLAAVDVEVIHDEMDGVCLRVLHRQLAGDAGEFECRAIRCGEGEMPPGLRLYSAKHIGRAAPFVLAIPPRFPPLSQRDAVTMPDGFFASSAMSV